MSDLQLTSLSKWPNHPVYQWVREKYLCEQKWHNSKHVSPLYSMPKWLRATQKLKREAPRRTYHTVSIWHNTCEFVNYGPHAIHMYDIDLLLSFRFSFRSSYIAHRSRRKIKQRSHSHTETHKHTFRVQQQQQQPKRIEKKRAFTMHDHSSYNSSSTKRSRFVSRIDELNWLFTCNAYDNFNRTLLFSIQILPQPHQSRITINTKNWTGYAISNLATIRISSWEKKSNNNTIKTIP